MACSEHAINQPRNYFRSDSSKAGSSFFTAILSIKPERVRAIELPPVRAAISARFAVIPLKAGVGIGPDDAGKYSFMSGSIEDTSHAWYRGLVPDSEQLGHFFVVNWHECM